MSHGEEALFRKGFFGAKIMPDMGLFLRRFNIPFV